MASNTSNADRSSHRTKRQKLEEPTFKEPTTFVTFAVGVPVEEFMVHKEVACIHSPILDAAFNSGFVEGQTQRYTVDDATPRAFRLLVKWMYGKKLGLLQRSGGSASRRGPPPARIQISDEARQSENESLAELWVLADKLCIITLQNLVIDSMFSIFCHGGQAPYTACKYIFANTSTHSELRRYTIDFCLSYLRDWCLEKNEAYFPRELLVSLTKNFAKERDLGKGCIIPEKFVAAAYHVFEDEATFITAPPHLLHSK